MNKIIVLFGCLLLSGAAEATTPTTGTGVTLSESALLTRSAPLNSTELANKRRYCSREHYREQVDNHNDPITVHAHMVTPSQTLNMLANYVHLTLKNETKGTTHTLIEGDSPGSGGVYNAYDYLVRVSEVGEYTLTAKYFFRSHNTDALDGVHVQKVFCTNKISVVEKTPIKLAFSAEVNELTLALKVTASGAELNALKICKANSAGGCDGSALYSCTSSPDNACQGKDISASVTYPLQYNEEQRFVAIATDYFGTTGRAEYAQPKIVEPNTSSTVSLAVYTQQGQPLADGDTLFDDQDVIVVAEIEDGDTTEPNWPSAATLNAQVGNSSRTYALDGAGTLTLNDNQSRVLTCFKSGNSVVNRNKTACFRQYPLSATTTLIARSGDGISNAVTLNMATRPNLTGIELSDDVVLPNTPMSVQLEAMDDGKPVDLHRLSLCLVPGEGVGVASCQGATPISVDSLTVSSGVYTASFNANAAPGRYALVMIVADDTDRPEAQALSAVPFTVQNSAGITLNYNSSNTQRTRGVEYSEQIEIGALSSEHSHVCRIALVEPNTASNGTLIASQKIDQPLPLLEDTPGTVSATMKWTPGLALPKSLKVKVRAYLRTGSQCDEQSEHFVDSTATYSYTLNSLVPINPRLELAHDGATKPGVIDITLTRNGGQGGDHATGYDVYEYVKDTSAAPPAQLSEWERIATLSADNLVLKTSIVKPVLDHNKHAFYCAVATNTDHSGELKYSNADCDQTQIRNEGTAPPRAYFSNAGHFFGPYTLEIDSERAYDAQSSLQWYFKLERKIGDGYWYTLASKLPVSRFNEHGPEVTYRVASARADQIVQYRVTAYNRNGAQSAPSTQTVQHTNAKIVGVTKGTNTREYIVSGAAFASTGNIVSVQQNTTGISHQLSAADITYVSSHELKIKVPASIDTAYSNGGFVVGVKNALLGASYATYNADSTSGQVEDPLNYTPTVGFNGQQYLGKGSAIYAEKDQRTLWYRTTGGTLSSRPVVTQSGSGSDVIFAGS
ncbi:hypothetical protein CWB99_23465, partial [Pseudoalteromonas rubra]